MKDGIKIPVAVQIRVDDVAWHNGADERFKNRPSRSGLPRKHHPLDYRILNELGKALDMKIGCSLVLGEWDKDNFLKGVPHVTYDEKNWDMAAQIDMEYAKECFMELDGSEFLEYTLHGLMHGYYDNGKLVTESQYYPLVYDKENKCYINKKGRLSKEEFRTHIELFMKIYNSWGFTKKISTFASPCGCYGSPEENRDYAEVLNDYSITCWPNGWSDLHEKAAVVNGIVCLKCQRDAIAWNAYDVDPRFLPDIKPDDNGNIEADFCMHWTNFVRFNPQNNLQNLPFWIDYFKKQAESFGIMLSKNTEFAASQALYNKFSRINAGDGFYNIDLSEVDKLGAKALKNEFYISLKNGIEPFECTGTSIKLYETKKDFKTYKITRNQAANIILKVK